MNEKCDAISADKAELAALRLENETLSNQLKHLVQAEGKLYAYQEQLDAQLKEYQGLYELSKKLCACNDLPAVFEQALSYIIGSVGYERVIIFRHCEAAGEYVACAVDGYYDAAEQQAVSSLAIPQHDSFLAPLLEGGEYRICQEGCTEPDLLAYRDKLQMDEYQLYLLGNKARPVAFLAVGNSRSNRQFYRAVSDPAALPGIGNLVGLLSSTIENQFLYDSMQKALEQETLAEARYRGIYENAMEGMYQSTPGGRFLSCNPATARILGYDTPQEVLDGITDIGRELYVDPARREELFEKLRCGLEVKNFEAEFYRKDGGRQWVRLSARPCFNENSDCLYIEGIIQDITEEKQTEDMLVKLSQAVEQSPATIVITDTKGAIEFVNPKFVQLTGYSFEEAIGKNPVVLKSDRTPPETHQKLWQTITAGNVWEGEFVNRKKNGDLFCERATISPIKNKDGVITHFLAIKEDITERKQLEAQLLQSQKMESVGRLAGGVAHDFNNMLSVIIGCAQLAMLKVSEGDKVWQYLSQISKAAERSSEVTRQLLAFSRKEIVSLKKVNLNAKIVETKTTLGRLIGEDIYLTFKPGPDLWTIEADPSQLDQILVNLAVNARDAMPGGGHLAIRTANIRVDLSYCHFHVEAKPGHYVQLEVNDSGCGMDKLTLSQIFEPFFTTKEVGKGTGLGLAMVYGIVKQNNGFLNVYSEPGQGTTFQLYFPKSDQQAEMVPEVREVEVSGSGIVLLVEDDPLVREMARQMLDEIGYTVIQALNALDAIEICQDEKAQIDLLLTDVVMPGMNGKELVDKIESLRPGLKVLFMSGYTSDLVAQRGVLDQGRHFIQKPFDMNSLNEKIKAALQDEQRSSS